MHPGDNGRGLFRRGARGKKARAGSDPAESRAVKPDASWLNGIVLHGAWGSSSVLDLDLVLYGPMHLLDCKQRQRSRRAGLSGVSRCSVCLTDSIVKPLFVQPYA